MEYESGKWENGSEHTYIFDGASKLNANKEPDKIADTDYADMLNLCRSVSRPDGLVRRNGIMFLGNPLPLGNMRQVTEAVLNNKRFLIARSSLDSRLYYTAYPYTSLSTWTLLYNNVSAYSDSKIEFTNVNNSLYLSNILKGDYMLHKNGIIKQSDGTPYYTPAGLTTHYADCFDMYSTTLSGGGLSPDTSYFYAITVLYDGYMESNTPNIKLMTTSAGHDTVRIYTRNYTGAMPYTKRHVKLKIYRSKAVATMTAVKEIYLLDTIDCPVENQAEAVFVDQKGDDDLFDPIDITELFKQSVPFRSRYMCSVSGRMVYANLQTEPEVYDAIPDTDISVATTTTGGGGFAYPNTYKIRVTKVIPSYTGDAFVINASLPYETEVNTIVTHRAIKITFAADFYKKFLDWVQNIMVEIYLPDEKWYTYGIYNTEYFRTHNYLEYLLPDEYILDYQSQRFDIVRAEKTETSDLPLSFVVSDYDKPESFSENTLINLDAVNNSYISGVFPDANRLTIFTDRNEYAVDASPLNTAYWQTARISEGIGAKGNITIKENIIYNETFNGIVKLPSNGGYIFFDKTLKTSGEPDPILYYWDGTGTAPAIISSEVSAYLSGDTVTIKAMTYDTKNGYIWILADNGENNILIFDFALKQWYRWLSGTFAQPNDVIQIVEGKIIFANSLGSLSEYTEDTYADQTDFDNSDLYYSYLKTKTFSYPESMITGVLVKHEYDTEPNGNIATVSTNANNLYSSEYSYTMQGGINRLVHRDNIPCNRYWVKIFHNNEGKLETKGLIIAIKKRNIKYG